MISHRDMGPNSTNLPFRTSEEPPGVPAVQRPGFTPRYQILPRTQPSRLAKSACKRLLSAAAEAEDGEDAGSACKKGRTSPDGSPIEDLDWQDDETEKDEDFDEQLLPPSRRLPGPGVRQHRPRSSLRTKAHSAPSSQLDRVSDDTRIAQVQTSTQVGSLSLRLLFRCTIRIVSSTPRQRGCTACHARTVRKLKRGRP